MKLCVPRGLPRQWTRSADPDTDPAVQGGFIGNPPQAFLMRLGTIVAPDSADQILLVVLLWVGVTVAIAQVFDSPWVRWETLLGSVAVFLWVAWAVYYRLEQYQQEQYARNRKYER